MAAMAAGITADPITEVIRAPSRWRLAIGLTTYMGRVIMQAEAITSGNQDIGQRETASESGSTVITPCDEAIRQRGQRLSAAWQRCTVPRNHHF
jgi:hypothetical protein